MVMIREDGYELEISQKAGGIMKFRRIDEDTVRCIVSKEDMQEYGIGLEDFFKNKSKIHEFLHEIVVRAEQEVGYEPKEGLLSMQIMPISQNTVAITFTEKEDGGYDDIVNNIKETVADIISEANFDGNIQEEEVPDSLEDGNSHVLIGDTEVLKTSQKNTTPVESTDFPDIVMMEMSSLDDVIRYCKTLRIDKPVKSELYEIKSKGLYYLVIEKKRLSLNDFKTITRLAFEYSSKVTNNKRMISYVREQGEVIFDKSAYRFLTTYM